MDIHYKHLYNADNITQLRNYVGNTNSLSGCTNGYWTVTF